jgi:hypothetical protein
LLPYVGVVQRQPLKRFRVSSSRAVCIALFVGQILEPIRLFPCPPKPTPIVAITVTTTTKNTATINTTINIKPTADTAPAAAAVRCFATAEYVTALVSMARCGLSWR